MGKRSKRAVLELLVLLVILISGTKAADDDVVAEADEMTRKIEEKSKKVDDQSNAMVSEIEAKSKTVEDANQEKRFEEASKHVDDVMDESEKAVDDKANFAEELENEAERKVEDLGKKIEGSHSGYNGISRKRSTSVITDLEPKQDVKSSHTIEKQKNTQDMTGKTKDKIEPSKVVVLPDVAIRGTDYTNMQIKELKSQKSHGIWLAVHIPDNATTLRPVKILSTKKAAEDLEKVIGPNRETMFKELQTIIGVDGPTLRQMLKSGQIDGRRNRKKHKDENDEEEEEEQEEEQEEDEEDSNGESDDDEEDDDEEEKEEKESNSGEDDKCEDDDDKEEREDVEEEEDEDEEDEDEEDEDEEDEEDNKNRRKHKNKWKNLKKLKSQMDKTRGKSEKTPNPRKKCSRQNLLPWTINDGGSGAEKNESAVFQPQGYKVPLAKLFNKIHVRLKRKKACKHATNPIIKELCKQMNRHHRRPRPNFNQPRRHLRLAHNKYYKHLKRLMRKFLDNHNGKQAQQVLQYMNLLLSDQLRLSPDGIVHLFPNRLGKPNNYGDGFKALADDESASKGQGNSPLEPPIMDDSMYNEHVIRVPEPASTRGTTAPNYRIVSNSQANVLNNQVHTKLGDARSEADMQMQMLKEELGKSNDELREQQKEKERDEAIMDKYMFNFQSLAEKGPMSTLDGMQKDAERRVNGQQVSVIDPNQISLKQSRLPIRNRLDVPSLGGYVGGQFTGFVRRNKIENHLKSFAKRIREHQRQQKATQSKKSGKGPRSINKTRPAKRAL